MKQNEVSESRPPSWCTAGVLDQSLARRFIGRLVSEGIDHHACIDGEMIRVSVRRSDMERALKLRGDANSRGGESDASKTGYRQHLRLLWTIPVGAFVGTWICYSFSWENRLIPALCSVLLAATVEVYVAGKSQRQDRP